MRVTRVAADNTLARIMRMVQEAQSQQSPTQQFTEQFTRWFVPAVLVLVALVIVIPPLANLMPLSESFYRGMLLLVAASPCALAIGTPAAVLAGIAQAARHGVLIKGGVHLENLGRVQVMAFDKTGTLTEGRFAVTDIVPLGDADEEQVLRLAGAVERQSNHPLAQAVVRAVEERGLQAPAAENVQNTAGRGLQGSVEGKIVRVGSRAFFDGADGAKVEASVSAKIDEYERQGKSTMLVAIDGRLVGLLALADQLRPGVAGVLKELADFDWQALPSLNRARILALAQGGYIEQAEPVLLIGNPGLGKTHIATSLALAGCRQGRRVRFYTAAGLINDLIQAQSEHRLARALATMLNYQLLVVDELGFLPLSQTGAHLLFQFCSSIHERVALIVTTNLRFAEWTQLFGSESLTAALLDRLTARAHIIEFSGESYRLRQRREREGHTNAADDFGGSAPKPPTNRTKRGQQSDDPVVNNSLISPTAS